jgi:hypothetical protein
MSILEDKGEFVNSRNLLFFALVLSVVHVGAREAVAQGVAESTPHEAAVVATEATIETRGMTFQFAKLMQKDRLPLRLALRPMPSRRFDFPTSSQSSPTRTWIKRHPILFGTFVGFGSA